MLSFATNIRQPSMASITAIPAPTCGWRNQPLPGHLNETDDIERIRHLRNNIVHNSDIEICDIDFYFFIYKKIFCKK
jgi:hypothetical protein